ncbi:SURP and G-patch domain-containing protein 1-like protein [Morella rubra]|uniref:SURP and G-patch domain-containing protein 1-like protein n=1 Tax=Morella rubra TaxID=262757 RepID=A0A6A1WI18_9ROSI|nr:SURP and G-patch domain-containing protein 1-like protein [Morella rubra]
MDKGTPPSLFVNDGSFMERFKQLQQEKASEKDTRAKLEVSKPITIKSGSLTANPTINKTSVEFKTNDTRKNPQGASGGKLAFSLKQKSKIVAPPVKLGADEDEDEIDAGKVSADAPMKRQKLDQGDASEFSSRQVDGVKKVADKLASFVAKNGRQFEDITRQKNPGDTPFKFLFDKTCPDYKYYEYQLAEEEKAFSQTREPQTSHSGVKSSSASKSTSGSQRSFQQHYQTPASALYDATEDQRVQTSAGGSGEASAPTGADPIAMMEFYMKKAAQEERFRQPKQSKDEMPPPASLQASQKATREAAERAKIQADNVGHKLLSKMGWKEGEGLGSSKNGIADPIMAGDVKMNNLGVGAHNPGEVTAEDDIYEQYKKRMMLGYRYRPNPLVFSLRIFSPNN